jgi:hypothetical protein
MFRALFGGKREREQFTLIKTGGDFKIGQLRLAQREGSGFIEGDGFDFSKTIIP